jgi:hypothetical protein|nr:MAG TPA: hypothetical protein [Caudoviricetes sp.]
MKNKTIDYIDLEITCSFVLYDQKVPEEIIPELEELCKDEDTIYPYLVHQERNSKLMKWLLERDGREGRYEVKYKVNDIKVKENEK